MQPIYKFFAETPPSSLGPKSSEMDRNTVETTKSNVTDKGKRTKDV